jgi:hypothetical protein
LEQPRPEYTCDVCGKSFKDADELARHQGTHRNEDDEKKPLEQGMQGPTETPSLDPSGVPTR